MGHLSRASIISVGVAISVVSLMASVRKNPPFSHRNVVGSSVSPAEFRTYVEGLRFNELSPVKVLHTMDGAERARASLAGVAVSARDSIEMGEGMIIGKIRSDRRYEPLGLESGDNYFWVDRKGPANHPWRAVMISSNGVSRHVLGMVYTHHADPAALKAHQQEYCDGRPGCFVRRDVTSALDSHLTALEGPWFPCSFTGCCRADKPPRN
jgi:hypothetical protein